MAMRTTGRHGDRRGAVVSALLAVLLGGCVVSPQPSPPVHDPILDGALVGVKDEVMVLGDQIALEGKPGAVRPAEGVIVVTNLDTLDAPVVADVNPDGSFIATVLARTEHVLRMQVKQGELRSEPADLRLAGPSSTEKTLDHLPCLELTPGAWVTFEAEGGSRDVVVRNACAEDVSIEAPRLRRGGAPFSVSPEAPFVVPPGGSTVVTVRADGDGEEREDVLFLDVTAPEPGRRALTLTLPD
ncbi:MULTISPECIES: hypothetical protein [Sorangium]|uniref:Uncharacterized protein n=1 Tax=Sorangium cellulosum TaxID=56 RepID=A0A4P2QMZ6_SORCE|nr:MULTISPECIES: hypothetical protein [Sorangium]AUX31228.1 hypothetical protein SOCE836_033570 [Sorangium cellulosum]WCQ90612.1 hypothetical protein NQZ70_03323 [Sorangium sp. Soce836]